MNLSCSISMSMSMGSTCSSSPPFARAPPLPLPSCRLPSHLPPSVRWKSTGVVRPRKFVVRNALSGGKERAGGGSPSLPNRIFAQEAIGAEYGEGFETFRMNGPLKVDVGSGSSNWENSIRSKENFGFSCSNWTRKRRRTVLCAVNKDAEQAFVKTVELDRLIDKMRDSNPRELDQLVVENVLALDEGFWIRLATRAETCKSEDDKKDYEELADCVMSIVDRLVHKTEVKIETATDVLKEILKPVIGEHEEISWPPRDPEALKLMEKEISTREQEGQLDESFLSEVNAQLRQAKEDGDKPGLTAMLQTVLQLYASKILRKRSYAYRGGKVIPREKFLESIIEAPESSWNKLLIDGLTIGKGDIAPEDLYAAVKKRIERVLIRTEGGSYEQRVLVEYLKGIESRTQELVQALQGGPTR